MGRRRPLLVVVTVLAAWLAIAAPSTAQQRPTSTPLDRPEIPPPLPISPGGAFLRAALVPGWGHAAIGSYGRGGFYVGAQAATLYTLFRTRARTDEVRRNLALRESVLRREAERAGLTDPDAIDALVDEDNGYAELSLLLDSREAQQEDLIAFSLFLVLLSGVDAYVSAHLARFPEPLDVGAQPSPTGGIELQLRVRLGN